MRTSSIFFILLLSKLFISNSLSTNRTISASETIVSPGNVFELGLFRSDLSHNWYLGIWYKKDLKKICIWVANIKNPYPISSGTLKLSDDQVVFSVENNSYIWSAKLSRGGVRSPVVAMLDNGNFVVKDSENSNDDEFLWQSFDHPTDTLVPHMKLGLDPKTGIPKNLTSWDPNDPSKYGDYYLEVINEAGLFELSVWISWISDPRFSSIYRSDLWDGVRFPEIPVEFSANYGEKSLIMTGKNNISRLTLGQHSLKLSTWKPEEMLWEISWISDFAKSQQDCGFDSYYSENPSPMCSCIKGFEPKSQEEWDSAEWINGCRRKTQLNCIGDEFVLLENMKLPDTRGHATVIKETGKEICEKLCLTNCSCNKAYANVDILPGRPGCVMWNGALYDFKQYSVVGGRDLYVKVAATIDHVDETKNNTKSPENKDMSTLEITLIITIVGAVGVAVAIFAIYYAWKRHHQNIIPLIIEPSNQTIVNEIVRQNRLEFMSFVDVARATDNFSEANKLGEGGFGVVYKGVLPNGETVAVKRLAKASPQGIDELTNEVQIISNVLHLNLVRLQGCCLEGQEQLLLYEYLENSSLNRYLFDEAQSPLLNWEKRYVIIKGIANGLLYLHNYATPPIIHRDVKPSNILLGIDMIPKISDFGLAKLVESGETRVNTERPCGTRGYMSRECALEGQVSEKSDVFSFGVTLLEIITGKRNIEYCRSHPGDNLLDDVWERFQEGNGLQVIDQHFVDSSLVQEEVMRCLQIGLLCVQDDKDDRPSTESVVLMLATRMMEIPQPRKPNYFYGRSQLLNLASSSTVTEPATINQMSISTMACR